MPNDDLISRKALYAAWDNIDEFEFNDQNLRIDEMIRLTQDAPAVDAKRVIRGEWVEKPYLFGTTKYCSRCGVNYGMPHGVFNYCPNCGAKMEGGVDDGIDKKTQMP